MSTSFYGKELYQEVKSDLPLRKYVINPDSSLYDPIEVEAHFLTFTSGHVNFWKRRPDNEQDTLVLARDRTLITTLKEVTP